MQRNVYGSKNGCRSCHHVNFKIMTKCSVRVQFCCRTSAVYLNLDHIYMDLSPPFFLKKKRKKNPLQLIKKNKTPKFRKNAMMNFKSHKRYWRSCEKHRRQTCHEYWNCHCFNFHWRKVIDSRLTMAQQSVGHMNGSHSRCHMLPMCRTPRRLFNALPICDLFSFLN